MKNRRAAALQGETDLQRFGDGPLLTLFFALQVFDERRHLLRLWICPPVERPLPDAYLEIYGDSVEIGNRGGIKVAGYKPTIPLEAE